MTRCRRRLATIGLLALLLGCDEAPPTQVTPPSAPVADSRLSVGPVSSASESPTVSRGPARSATPGASPAAPDDSASAPAPDPDATSFARVPTAKPDPGPAPPSGFAAAAANCMTDPLCQLDRYASLVLAAADAGEAGTPCVQLLRGVGVPVDQSRAGACFDRAVTAEGPCTGSSPSVERLQLALMQAFGRGRPRDTTGAMKTLEGCYADGSVAAVDEVIRGQRAGVIPKLDSLDVCNAGLAQTTLHMSMCLQVDLDMLEVRAEALEKVLVGRFDKAFIERYGKVSAELTTYSEAMGRAAADVYRNGTIATLAFPGAIHGVVERRVARWERLLRSGIPSLPDAKETRAKLLAARDAVPSSGQADQPWRELVRKTEKTYGPYRAHEAALLQEGARLTREQAETLLDLERIEDLGLLDSP